MKQKRSRRRPASISIMPASSESIASESPSNGSSWRWHLGIIGLLGLLCLGLYGWTLSFPMVFDDIIYIKSNPLTIRPDAFGSVFELPAFMKAPSIVGVDGDLSVNYVLRPLTYATFRLNYLLGGFDPSMWRAVNVAIHILNSGLVYLLVWQLLTVVGDGKRLSDRVSLLLAGTIAVVFAVHPMATESVTYIVQRFTSLSATFYLGTLVLHVAAWRTQVPRTRWMLRVASLIALLLGLATKEVLFTAPFVAFILELVVLRSTWRIAVKRTSLLLGTLPIIPALVIVTSWAQAGGDWSIERAFHLANSTDEPMGHWQYIVTEFTVLVGYLRRAILPYGLCIDPEWPLFDRLANVYVIGSMALLVSIIAAAWFYFRRHREEALPRLVFAGVLWFFTVISVSSGLVPLHDVMADHRTYLPCVGLFMALVCVVYQGCARMFEHRGGIVFGAMMVLISIGYSCATVKRNEVWRSDVSLWKDAATKSPGKYRVWSNLGAAYEQSGRYEEAIDASRRAIALEPQLGAAYVNASRALYKLQRYADAEAQVEALLSANPNAKRSPDVMHWLGVTLVAIGRLDDGVGLLHEVALQVPTHRATQLSLALYYWKTKQPSLARTYFEQAGKLAPLELEYEELIRQMSGEMLADR